MTTAFDVFMKIVTWAAAYITLRTLAPEGIAWWQAGAIGGTAWMLASTWINSIKGPNT